jgi:hypothetical protein
MFQKLLPLILLLQLTGVAMAADANAAAAAAEKRLRDTLRSTMLQLRTAEADKIALQAAQAESDQKNKDLTAQLADLGKKVEALNKQSAADKDAASKEAAGLNNRLKDAELEIERLKVSLEKWKVGYKQAVDVATTKESQRAALTSQVVVLNRELEDRTAKNIELFKIGSEILTRYEKFGLGTALTAREPFVGTTRVKIQGLVQDYQDKLVDQKIKLPETPGKKPAATPAGPSSPAAPVSKTEKGKLPPSEAPAGTPAPAQAQASDKKSDPKAKP